MDIIGMHPSIFINTVVTARVIHCVGHDNLDGRLIEFPFKSIQWNTKDIEPGGIYISILDYKYTIVEHDSMIIKSL